MERDGWYVFGTILTWVIGVLLILSGMGKIFGVQMLVDSFAGWGLGDFMIIIGIIEIVFAVLFLVSGTSVIAGYFLSAFFGGAIATHWSHGEPLLSFMPFVLLIVMWVAMFLKKPGVFSW